MASEVLIAPIRHHSPAAALQVRRLIQERRPRRVLIEGPADATAMVPLLADAGTVPPIALYAYRPGAEGRALFYPFCAYSPEYVAITEGRASGADVRFCDVPASVSLDWTDDGPIEDSDGDATDGRPDYAAFAAALASAAGTSSFEELWEAAFEQEAREPAAYAALLGDFGRKSRELADPRWEARDRCRERAMAAEARAALAEGIPSDRVLLVCGAAHAAAIAAAIRDDEADPERAPGEPAEISLIPYSYPRLSEQSGYGAGNRAPWYYQEVWERGLDYAAATRRALVALAAGLRNRGQSASLAQCIDAFSLAVTLARLRDKLAPGVEELTDAAVACFGQGQPAVVAETLRLVLIGDAVGRVTQRVGRTPLQSEFYATANQLRLPVLDAPRQALLHLMSANEVAQSIFLHRLAVAEIPFGRELESGLARRGQAKNDDPLEQLGRVREKWELQWSPSTDAALVERSAWGSTLAEVCGRRLRRQLTSAGQVDDATGTLLRLVLCDLLDDLPAALEQCETLAAGAGSFAPLARAAYHLDGLLGYGAARRLPVEALTGLARRLFARAVLHLASSVQCGEEAAAEVERALISLSELVRRGSPIVEDPALFWAAVARSAELVGCYPALRGLCLTLQELAGQLAPGALAARLRYWLSTVSTAIDNAQLVAGLFALHRGTLIRNRGLIDAVTEFLGGLAIDELVPLLPVLRRTLGNLSPAERAYLAETLEAVVGRVSDDRLVSALTSDEVARLRAADAEVARVLATWKERYGIG